MKKDEAVKVDSFEEAEELLAQGKTVQLPGAFPMEIDHRDDGTTWMRHIPNEFYKGPPAEWFEVRWTGPVQ